MTGILLSNFASCESLKIFNARVIVTEDGVFWLAVIIKFGISSNVSCKMCHKRISIFSIAEYLIIKINDSFEESVRLFQVFVTLVCIT